MTIPSRLPPYDSCRLAPTNHSCYAVLIQARHLLGIVAYENNYTNLFYNVVDRHYFYGATGVIRTHEHFWVHYKCTGFDLSPTVAQKIQMYIGSCRTLSAIWLALSSHHPYKVESICLR